MEETQENAPCDLSKTMQIRAAEPVAQFVSSRTLHDT